MHACMHAQGHTIFPPFFLYALFYPPYFEKFLWTRLLAWLLLFCLNVIFLPASRTWFRRYVRRTRRTYYMQYYSNAFILPFVRSFDRSNDWSIFLPFRKSEREHLLFALFSSCSSSGRQQKIFSSHSQWQRSKIEWRENREWLLLLLISPVSSSRDSSSVSSVHTVQFISRQPNFPLSYSIQKTFLGNLNFPWYFFVAVFIIRVVDGPVSCPEVRF